MIPFLNCVTDKHVTIAMRYPTQLKCKKKKKKEHTKAVAV